MSTFNKHALLYGSIIAILLLVYLGLMTAINQVHNFNLRAFNLVIIGVGVFLSIKRFLMVSNIESNYLLGLGVGALTSLFASFIFSTSSLYNLIFQPSILLKKHKHLNLRAST